MSISSAPAPGFQWAGHTNTYEVKCPLDKLLKWTKFSQIKDWPGFPLKGTATGDDVGDKRTFDLGEWTLEETYVTCQLHHDFLCVNVQ